MADYVPADTSTTAGLTLGASVYGSIETAGDHDFYRIDLEAGKTYEFRLHGMGVDQITDPDLSLRDVFGTEIARNDDSDSWAGGSLRDSRLVFTATVSGTHYVDAATYLDGSGRPRTPSDMTTGDFLLTAVEANPDGMVFTPDEIAWQLANNGFEFFHGAPASFAVGIDGALSCNVSALTAEGQVLARAALQAWSQVSGITFVEISGAAELNFDDNAGGARAYSEQTVSGTTITSSSVMITTGWLGAFGATYDSYSYETYIHEIGHALGLGHGGNYNNNASFGDLYYLNDSPAYSIMSYFQAEDDEFVGPVNPVVDADFRYMLTPALADIIAIQNLYGEEVATSTRTGDTTYGYGSNTGDVALDQAVSYGADMFMCVYDDGGADSLDFSDATVDQLIDLNDESFSNVLGGKMNLSIARGAIIEKGFGGFASDTLIGNEVANLLSGHGGSDSLSGGAGNDSLQGGLAADALIGGAGTDTAVYVGSDAAVAVSLAVGLGDGGDATGDTLAGIENLTGSLFADTLTGDGGDNFLNDGGVGESDILTGGRGDDTYAVYNATAIIETAGGGVDRVAAGLTYVLAEGVSVEQLNTTALRATSAIDLFGNDLKQLVRGNDGANVLDGGGGGDVLFGMGGADAFRFSTALGAGNIDRIADFSVADDTILLDDAIFAGLDLGRLAASAFKDTAAAPRDADDRIIYNSNTGALGYDADGSAAAFGIVRFATLTDRPPLTAADFFVV